VSVSQQIAQLQGLLELRRWNEALRRAQDLIAADPERPDGYYFLGRAQQQLGWHQKAVSAFDLAIAKSPRAYFFVHKSHSLRELKRGSDALKAAEEAVRLAPEDGPSHMSLALSAQLLGDRDRADTERRHAVRLGPSNANLHMLSGYILLKQKRYKEAEHALRKSLELDPNAPLTFNNLGVALQNQGRKEDAALAYKSAVLLDPTLRLAKRNTHAVMQSMFGKLGGVGVSLWVLLKLAQGLAAANLVTRASGGSAIAAGLTLVGAATWVVLHFRKRQRLRARNPELLALYQRLEADRKAGRL